MRLLAITPGDGRHLDPWLGAIAPWVDGVVLREPRAAATDLARWVDIVRRSGATAIRHARTAPVHADAVHVPDGFPFPEAGPFGVSCHTADGVHKALTSGASYALLSPVFDPTSKPATHPALGIERFLAMAPDPRVLALGGITIPRAATLAQHGRGVAVLGALFGQPTPAAAGQAAWGFRRLSFEF